MIDTKELRRLAQAALAGPDGISLNWIKLLQDFQQSANPAAISELLDRLEAEESKQAALLDCLNEWKELAKSAEKERDALRARIEAIKPVAWLDDGTCREGSEATAHRVVTNEAKRDMPASVAASFSVPLGVLPGAKGE